MKTDLIYGVEDRPPFKDALFAALQHLLAIFVAIITPPLIIASALKLRRRVFWSLCLSLLQEYQLSFNVAVSER